MFMMMMMMIDGWWLIWFYMEEQLYGCLLRWHCSNKQGEFKFNMRAFSPFSPPSSTVAQLVTQQVPVTLQLHGPYELIYVRYIRVTSWQGGIRTTRIQVTQVSSWRCGSI